MRITAAQLRRIIKEEIDNAMSTPASPRVKTSYYDRLGKEFPVGTQFVTARGIEYVSLSTPWARLVAGSLVPTVDVQNVETGKKQMILLSQLKKV
jgi:hypothetical protein